MSRVVEHLAATPEGECLGLSSKDAAQRLAAVGPNALPEAPPPAPWRRFAGQFASPLVYILLFALALDVALWLHEGLDAWPVEATAIGLILLLNATLGLYPCAPANAFKRLNAASDRLSCWRATH